MNRVKRLLLNMLNQIEVHVVGVMYQSIKIQYVYQEKTIQVEEHDVTGQQMNGIMSIVLIN